MTNGFVRSFYFVIAIFAVSSVFCFANEIETHSIVTIDGGDELFYVVNREGNIITVRKIERTKMLLSLAARTSHNADLLRIVDHEDADANNIMAIGEDDTFMDAERQQMPVERAQRLYVQVGQGEAALQELNALPVANEQANVAPAADGTPDDTHTVVFLAQDVQEGEINASQGGNPVDGSDDEEIDDGIVKKGCCSGFFTSRSNH